MLAVLSQSGRNHLRPSVFVSLCVYLSPSVSVCLSLPRSVRLSLSLSHPDMNLMHPIGTRECLMDYIYLYLYLRLHNIKEAGQGNR